MNSCKQKPWALLLAAFVFISTNVVAVEESSRIPVMDDSRIFAKFTDDFPAVVNYFTQHSEQQIIAFYQEKYGEIKSKQRKRGRLTLVFALEHTNVRVVISRQNNMMQVDVIQFKKTEK
jgi:hypothetical protein